MGGVNISDGVGGVAYKPVNPSFVFEGRQVFKHYVFPGFGADKCFVIYCRIVHGVVPFIREEGGKSRLLFLNSFKLVYAINKA